MQPTSSTCSSTATVRMPYDFWLRCTDAWEAVDSGMLPCLLPPSCRMGPGKLYVTQGPLGGTAATTVTMVLPQLHQMSLNMHTKATPSKHAQLWCQPSASQLQFCSCTTAATKQTLQLAGLPNKAYAQAAVRGRIHSAAGPGIPWSVPQLQEVGMHPQLIAPCPGSAQQQLLQRLQTPDNQHPQGATVGGQLLQHLPIQHTQDDTSPQAAPLQPTHCH